MNRAGDFQQICNRTEGILMSISTYIASPENLPNVVELLTRTRSAVEVIVYEKMKARGVKVRMRRAGIASDCIANFLRDRGSVTLETLFRMYAIAIKSETEEISA